MTLNKENLFAILNKLITDISSTSITIIPLCTTKRHWDNNRNSCDLYDNRLASCDALSLLVRFLYTEDYFDDGESNVFEPLIGAICDFAGEKSLSTTMKWVINYATAYNILDKRKHYTYYKFDACHNFLKKIKTVNELLIHLYKLREEWKTELNRLEPSYYED